MSNTNLSDRMTYANSADPYQTAPEGESDQGLHCLLFHHLYVFEIWVNDILHYMGTKNKDMK